MPEGVTSKFGTGAVRSDTCEQYRYDLITPIGLREVARTCAEGAAKYDDYNWEKGMPVHDLLNHAIAHVYQFLAGDRSEPHLPHAAWNLLAAIHSDQLWPELNAGTLRGEGCCRPLAVAGRGAEPATPQPHFDLAAIRERARRWSGPFTPTYKALADDILALANALEQATAGASGGNEQASTAEK